MPQKIKQNLNETAFSTTTITANSYQKGFIWCIHLLLLCLYYSSLQIYHYSDYIGAMKQILYKVPNGKLLRIFLEKENDKIVDIKITGDFFVYPEEKISLMEDCLRGKILNEDQLVNDLNKVIVDESMELFGVDSKSIVTALFL